MSQLYLIDRFGSVNPPLARILDVQESATNPPTTPNVAGRFVVKVADGISIVQPQNLGDLITKKALGYLIFYAGYTRVTFDDLIDTSNVDFTNSVGLVAGMRGELILQPGGVLQSLPTPLAAGLSGTGANIVVTSPGPGQTVTVSGLLAVPPDVALSTITISGSSIAANNGSFQILSWLSSTSVTINNPSAQTDTGNDTWSFGPVPNSLFLTWDTYDFLDSDPSSGSFVRMYNELPSVPSNVTCQASFNGGSTYLTVTDSEILSIASADQGSLFIIQLTNASTAPLSIGSWTIVY